METVQYLRDIKVMQYFIQISDYIWFWFFDKDAMLFPVEVLFFLGVWLSAYFLLRWLLGIGLGTARHRYPPSLPSLPIVGSLPFIQGFNNIADFFRRKADQLGPIFTFRSGSR